MSTLTERSPGGVELTSEPRQKISVDAALLELAGTDLADPSTLLRAMDLIDADKITELYRRLANGDTGQTESVDIATEDSGTPSTEAGTTTTQPPATRQIPLPREPSEYGTVHSEGASDVTSTILAQLSKLEGEQSPVDNETVPPTTSRIRRGLGKLALGISTAREGLSTRYTRHQEASETRKAQRATKREKKAAVKQAKRDSIGGVDMLLSSMMEQQMPQSHPAPTALTLEAVRQEIVTAADFHPRDSRFSKIVYIGVLAISPILAISSYIGISKALEKDSYKIVTEIAEKFSSDLENTPGTSAYADAHPEEDRKFQQQLGIPSDPTAIPPDSTGTVDIAPNNQHCALY